ncbi:MAG TPA: type II secretion system protein [Dictyoglomaceae bacterium]|nr:type II secretion system protein [Dictyoglomaceae bacterium]HOP95450.1 type II secretion system protein [Dictyoglomaceae bacterium]HPP15605.1 type II secretion system protein [Dictyoglomaceae bacterium]HPU42921.1 type II secretion system protein [Dictyoglomaceae bacterium]
MKEKGMSLTELLISMTVLSIILVVICSVWFSIQRDTLIHKIDSELERGISLATSNLRSDILKATVIYTPGVSITIRDNSGSVYGVGNYNFVTNSQSLVVVVPKGNNTYRFGIYLTKQRTGSLYESTNPDAKILLYYSKDLSWNPTYSQGNIQNLVTSFTFTSGEPPKVLSDYLASDGFKVKYFYVSGGNFVELTTLNYTPSVRVQSVEVYLRALRRWGNFQRERTATITLAPTF